MRGLVSHIVIFALFAATASASSAAPANRWPFVVRGQLSDADIRAIVSVVDRSGPDVAKHIGRIDVKSPNKVEVVTFNVPDNAAGNIIVVLKQRARWIEDKEHLGVWIRHF
jgi:hypothetical protein